MKFNLKCPACGHTQTKEVAPGPDAPQCPKCLCDMMATKVLSVPVKPPVCPARTGQGFLHKNRAGR